MWTTRSSLLGLALLASRGRTETREHRVHVVGRARPGPCRLRSCSGPSSACSRPTCPPTSPVWPSCGRSRPWRILLSDRSGSCSPTRASPPSCSSGCERRLELRDRPHPDLRRAASRPWRRRRATWGLRSPFRDRLFEYLARTRRTPAEARHLLWAATFRSLATGESSLLLGLLFNVRDFWHARHGRPGRPAEGDPGAAAEHQVGLRGVPRQRLLLLRAGSAPDHGAADASRRAGALPGAARGPGGRGKGIALRHGLRAPPDRPPMSTRVSSVRSGRVVDAALVFLLALVVRLLFLLQPQPPLIPHADAHNYRQAGTRPAGGPDDRDGMGDADQPRSRLPGLSRLSSSGSSARSCGPSDVPRPCSAPSPPSSAGTSRGGSRVPERRSWRGSLIALFPGLVLQTGEIHTETLATTLFWLGLALLVRGAGGDRLVVPDRGRGRARPGRADAAHAASRRSVPGRWRRRSGALPRRRLLAAGSFALALLAPILVWNVVAARAGLRAHRRARGPEVDGEPGPGRDRRHVARLGSRGRGGAAANGGGSSAAELDLSRDRRRQPRLRPPLVLGQFVAADVPAEPNRNGPSPARGPPPRPRGTRDRAHRVASLRAPAGGPGGMRALVREVDPAAARAPVPARARHPGRSPGRCALAGAAGRRPSRNGPGGSTGRQRGDGRGRRAPVLARVGEPGPDRRRCHHPSGRRLGRASLSDLPLAAEERYGGARRLRPAAVFILLFGAYVLVESVPRWRARRLELSDPGQPLVQEIHFDEPLAAEAIMAATWLVDLETSDPPPVDVMLDGSWLPLGGPRLEAAFLRCRVPPAVYRPSTRCDPPSRDDRSAAGRSGGG